MAAFNGDLKSVLVERLESAGVLNELRARIRAELLSAMEGKESAPPPLCNQNLLINELIREYLLYNCYHCSSSVLVAESGQPREPLDREFLCRELRISPDHNSKSLPLLYTMLAYFMSTDGRPADHAQQAPPHQQGDVDVSGGTSSTTNDDDDDDDDDDDIGNNTTDEQSHRAADSDTVHITDNITITQPVYVDHH